MEWLDVALQEFLTRVFLISVIRRVYKKRVSQDCAGDASVSQKIVLEEYLTRGLTKAS